MKFQHKIPSLYYSITEDISNERYETELDTIQRKFPDYEIKTSKDLLKGHDDWKDKIENIINSTDVVIFSFPEKMDGDYLYILNLIMKQFWEFEVKRFSV